MRLISCVQLTETDESFPFRLLIDEPDVALGNHWHKELEIIYLLKGGLQIYINGIGYSLCEGDIVFMAGGDVHGALRSLHNVRIVIQFDDNIYRNNYLNEQDIDEIRKKLNSLERVSTFWPSEVKSEIISLIYRLKNEYSKYQENKNTFTKVAIQSLLYELLMICLNKIPVSSEQSVISGTLRNKDILVNLNKVLHYLNLHYMENITLKDAAAILNFAPNYFVRFWKRYMGISFHTYLNHYRINTAISMLMDRQYQINEISMHVGFKNIKTFNRLFKEITGTSPCNYRKVYF